MLDARALHPGGPPALIASRVVSTDGRPHPMNTPRTKPFAEQGGAARPRRGRMPADPVGVVRVDPGRRPAVCRARGLPEADYFLWNDDFEFTARLLRGHGLLCPASVVVHKTAAFGSTDADPGQRFFYEVRNKVWMLRTRSSWPPRNGCCMAAPRCAAGPAPSPGPPTGARSDLA